MFYDNWFERIVRSFTVRTVLLIVLVASWPDIMFKYFGIDTDPSHNTIVIYILAALAVVANPLKQSFVDHRASPVGQMLMRLALTVVVLVYVLTTIETAPAVDVEDDTAAVIQTEDDPTFAQAEADQMFDDLAVSVIGKWEGLRLNAYKDIVGVVTVCYGHTRTAKMGQTYTKDGCDELLAQEIDEYRENLHKYFTAKTRAERLTIPRDVAYTSLAFNVGWAGAGKSTATRRLNAGDIVGGCDALAWWNRAGGRVVRGLVNRRAEERNLCLQGAT